MRRPPAARASSRSASIVDLADDLADQPVDGLGEQQGERVGRLGLQHLQRLGEPGERVALGRIFGLDASRRPSA